MYSMFKEFIPTQNSLKKRKEEGILIVKDKNMNIHYLNEVAKDFYELIDGKKNIEEIIQELLINYDVCKKELEKDCIELVRDLQWKEIILIREVENEKV